MQPVSHTPHMPPPAAHPVGRGKSTQSVGHLAKAAVAAAVSTGQDVPKNAQGFAASAISGGADPATVFAAMVQELPPEVTTGEVAETPVQDTPPAEAIVPTTLTEAEAALELLTDGAEPEV